MKERLRLDFMDHDYFLDLSNNPEKYYQEPFRIAGNLYFIGSKEIGCYLIDSGEGLIILDTGFDFSASQLIDSIWRLGFDPKDTKMIFHTHLHHDHTAVTKFLVRLSGAKTYMGKPDAEDMIASIEKNGPSLCEFIPDVQTVDGDEFTLGNVTIRCYDTPGHSRGNQSFFFNVTDGDKQYVAALHGGLGINTLHWNFMQKTGYTTAREEFLSWIDRFNDWKVDIYLGSHVIQGYMIEKREYQLAHPGTNPFIDPEEWNRVLTIAKEMCYELIEDEKEGKVAVVYEGDPSRDHGAYPKVVRYDGKEEPEYKYQYRGTE